MEKVWRFDKNIIHELMKKKEILPLPEFNYVYDRILEAELIANGDEIKVKTTYKGGREQFIEFLKTIKERYNLPKGVRIKVTTVTSEKLKDIEEFYMLRIKSKMSLYWEYLNGKISWEEFSKYFI